MAIRFQIHIKASSVLCAVILASVLVMSSGVAFAQPGDTIGSLRVDACPEPVGDTHDARQSKQQAGERYDRGLVLYDEGDYKGAVDSFVESYCATPHPAVFYNIAQSYERLLEFELSVAYFLRYAKEADPEAPTTRKAALRAEVLQALPAQIRVATVPAGAAIAIHDSHGLRARGAANQEAPLEVVGGRYTMHVSLPGYQDLTRAIETRPGQPYSYYLKLEPNTGTMRVSTTPSSARIFLNKRLVGVGKYTGVLPVGTYELSVELANRKTIGRSLRISKDKTTEERVVLAPPHKSGRTTLLVASGLALGTTGVVTMSNIFKQDRPVTIAGSLAAVGVGLGGAYYGIPNSITRGDGWYIIESSLIGFLEGSFVGSFFSCEIISDAGAVTKNCTGSEDDAILAAGLTGGLIGVAIGATTRKTLQLDTGDAAVVGSAALWGLGTGALLYAIFDSDLRIRDATLFSGLNLGLVAGAGILATSDVSLERVAIIDLGGVGGLLGGATLAQAFESGDERLQHFSLFGMVAGLIASAVLTREMDQVSSRSSPTKSHDSRLTPVVGRVMDAAGRGVPNLGFSLRM